MKLNIAVEIGKECGLNSIGEAINNIIIHAMNIFSYDKINEEIDELMNEFNKSGYNANTLIKDVKF